MRIFRFAPRVALSGVALWLFPLLVSCGGGGGTDAPVAPPPAPTPVPASIRLSQSGPISLIAGQNASLTATVLDASGQTLSSAVVNWTSSSPTIVGVGGSGSSTTLSAVGPSGTASVQASSGAVTSAAVVVNVAAAAPSRLSVTANGTQTRAVGDTTLTMLVRVTDQFNNPVPGVTIAWSTTGGALQSATTASNADGSTSNRLTLGNVPGAFVVTAALTGAAPVAFSIRATAGTAAQIGTGTALPASLVVGSTAPITAIITDRFGNRVAGVPVAFTSTTGTATIAPASATSDENGIAAASVTLGRVAGPETIQAAVSGLTGSPLVFTTTALPGPAAMLVKVGVDPAPAPAGTALSDVLRVRVTDQFNNPVTGATITWSTTGGTLVSTTTASIADGVTSNRLTLGTVAGSFLVTAALAGATPVTFSIRVTAGTAAQIAVGTALPASLVVGSTAPLAAIITDRFGNRVAGVPVAFTSTTGTATVSPAAAISDENGIAAASVTLGRLAGPQTIQAAVNGLTGSPLAFTTTALPGPAASIARVSPDPAPAPAGAALGDSIRVRVVDVNGNGVAGIAVVFSISGGGGSVSPAIATSAADGVAATRWVSGPTAATNTLVASAGVLTPVSFTATTTVPIGPPAVVSLASPRLVFLDSGTTTALTATARDANGVTVPNPAIQFSARTGSVIGTSGNVLTGLRRGQSIVTATAGSATPDSVLAVVLGANGITLQTDLTRLDIRPDETFTVPVIVDLRASTERLGSAVLTITFDPTQLSFVSRAAGVSGVNPAVNDAQGSSGRITLTFADATGFSGRIELLRLTFRATASTGRTGSLTLSATELNSTTFADLTGRLTAITYPLVIR
jgi:adhesin/invasin